MKQVIIRGGQPVVEEVPAPMVEPGTVLVWVEYSCISPGTELSGIRASNVPLLQRAIREPGLIKRAINMVRSEGLRATKQVVQQAQSEFIAGHATGYSASGIVLEVGDGIDDLRPGDRVACAGAQFAHHAEIIRVPRNLVAPVPDGVDPKHASTTTLGAIALQGVRRAQPTLGETFVVIGLGALGQLVVQLMKANGCKVLGVDLDPARAELAQRLGLDHVLHSAEGPVLDQVARLTGGIGADGVIITASTPSHEVISNAFRFCRRKGRVVLVGDVGLHLNRADFYEKELDFFISTSYGPGRYDRIYEERGLDYPVGYVRWTENRNMQEYLRLVAEKKVVLDRIVTEEFPVAEAGKAYERLKAETARPLLVVLQYPRSATPHARLLAMPKARAPSPGTVGVALVGAGSFAKSTHLPNLKALESQFQLRAVHSRTGLNATQTAQQHGAGYATTDLGQILRDDAVHAVLISTRHHLHGPLAQESLAAGKHVFVEKPLCLTRDELAAIGRVIGRSGPPPVLQTGFNRRFSPHARRLHQLLQARKQPMILQYRMNAGYLPHTHWTQGPEGGGRNLGEACHVYDLFTYLTGARLGDVRVRSIGPRGGPYVSRDNFVATIGFEDGSLATLTYTAMGSSELPKERLEVFVEGRAYVLDDYRSLTVHGAKQEGLQTSQVEKGHREQLAAFAAAIREGTGWPIPWWQQEQAMEIAFRVEEGLKGSTAVRAG